MITKLPTQLQDEHRAFMALDLTHRDYVYIWVDGVHFNVRLEQNRLCCLVIVGVRLDGTKEFVAIADGYRESMDTWADLLRGLKRRAMRVPVVAIGDGGARILGGLRDVWPETREQRDWFARSPTNSTPSPKSAQPTARKVVTEIRDAEDRDTPSRPRSASMPSSERAGPRPPTRSVTTSTGC